MKKVFYIFLGGLLIGLWSCNRFSEAHLTQVQELAWNSEKVKVVGSDGGTVEIPVYSNGRVYISKVDEADWAVVSADAIDGDAVVTVSVEANAGKRRMVRLAMTLDGSDLKDTVFVRQEGTKAYLECNAPYLAVNGAEKCDVEFKMTTNVPADEIEKKMEYVAGEGGWLDEAVVKDMSQTLSKVTTISSENLTSRTRKAKISLSHVDGWGERHVCDLYVTQSKSDGEFGSDISFDEARALGTAEGAGISEDLLIEGIVVSDYKSRNMDENTNISHDVVDSLYALSTAYLVSMDGQLGFRIKFTSASENVLMQGTKLQLNLNGAVITKETDPERYTISEINGTNMVGSEEGTPADVPVKSRTIASLTDDDVYTFVSLQNTEFIFKYGTFADVYENYTLHSSLHENPVNSSNNGRMDGWATLLVDASGQAIYAPINMLCLWRRNPVPQGIGATNGIIVHNKLPKVGNVGKYQIRVLDRSGFMQGDAGSSYEEFCIWNGKGKYIHSAFSNRNARYNHDQKKPTESIIPSSDIMDYEIPADKTTNPVWPKGELFLENRVSANGAWPMNNGEYYCRHKLEILKDAEGKDIVDIGENPVVQPIQGESEIYYAFNAIVNVKGWYNFDSEKNLMYNEDGTVNSNGFRYEFSTKDLSGSGLLFSYDMAAGTININTSKTFPAHWCVEYSVDGGETYTRLRDLVSGQEYVHLRSLPWWDGTINGTLYRTCAAAGLGFAQHAVLLPASVLGQDLVKVRLRPYDAKITTLPVSWFGDNETAEIQYSTSASNYVKIGSAKFSVLK